MCNLNVLYFVVQTEVNSNHHVVQGYHHAITTVTDWNQMNLKRKWYVIKLFNLRKFCFIYYCKPYFALAHSWFSKDKLIDIEKSFNERNDSSEISTSANEELKKHIFSHSLWKSFSFKRAHISKVMKTKNYTYSY